MRLLRSAMVMSLVLVGFASSVTASEFRTMGPRAMSMGKASVARPSPAYAAYYNPAALGIDDRGGIEMAVGVCTRDTGLSEHLDPLINAEWDTATENPSGPEAAAIIAELRQVKDTDALIVTPSAAAGVKIGSIAVGIYPSAQAVIYTHVDLVNISTAIGVPNSFTANDSRVCLQGLGLVEVPLAYGHAFKLGQSGRLGIGGSVKYIEGATYDLREGVQMASSEDLSERMNDADTLSSNIGVDLGILYRSEGDRLSLGLLARNLNSPSFETVTPGESFKEDAQVRAGLAYNLSEHFVCAADIDVTANKTLVPGYTSRQLSVGIGYERKYFSLRGGATKNIEASGSPVSFSLGTTLGSDAFHFDLAGSVSSSWENYEDYSFPVEGGLMLAIGGGW